MTNKNTTTLISLMNAFDDICEKALKPSIVPTSTFLSDSTISTGNTITTGDTIYGSYQYSPSDWYDWNYWWSTPSITYKIETPSYPVSNYSVKKDGTSVIEIAVSGFDSEEITVKREDLKIIVIGEKKEGKGVGDRKYIYKHIGERDFELSYCGSEKWDYDKLNVKLSKGILSIEIPIKEECKPINKTYKISN
jgi:HSP20 family molecular chaperone IbpA